jgi:hypothetical protein
MYGFEAWRNQPNLGYRRALPAERVNRVAGWSLICGAG